MPNAEGTAQIHASSQAGVQTEPKAAPFETLCRMRLSMSEQSLNDASGDLYPISFRVVRFAIKEGLYETVMTNLPADRFPPPLLRELYHKRRGIETSFSFFAEETPRFCPALFSDAYVYVTASELFSRRRLSWGGYLNNITAKPVVCTGPLRAFYQPSL